MNKKDEPTTVKNKCAIIDARPPACVSRISIRNITPVAATPMMYSTDIALVVASITLKSSVILSGQSISETLNPVFNSNALTGLNANGTFRLEHLSTSCSKLLPKEPSQYVRTWTV